MQINCMTEYHTELVTHNRDEYLSVLDYTFRFLITNIHLIYFHFTVGLSRISYKYICIIILLIIICY